MATTKFGPNDLLEYNPTYKILVCRECQHAVQKNALRSHLLRHKIYRDERQRLLSSIARLDLLDPADVPLPAPGLPPVGGIAVLAGYRCTKNQCGHLTVSIKRMKRHWNELHGTGGSIPSLFSFALAVRLQTLFRGTQLRYHEVAGLSSNARDDTQGGSDSATEEVAEVMQNAPEATSMKPPAASDRECDTLELTPKSILPTFDIEALEYFHHFITVTSLTLPGPSDPNNTIRYWQTHIIKRAFQHHWLLCGILAISALQCAILNPHDRAHPIRQKDFSHSFSLGFDQANHRSDNGPAEMNDETGIIGEQISCLIRLAQWTLDAPMPDDGKDAASAPLLSIIATIKGAAVPQSISNQVYVQDVPTKSNSLEVSSYNINPSVAPILNHLHSLPSQMAEALGRPESAHDVLATLSAINTLMESCNISFASDSIASAWQGMMTWLAQISDHFVQMIARLETGALVVLAHWVEVLVMRAVGMGCWFLRGAAGRIGRVVRRELEARSLAVGRLVDIPT